MMSLWANCNCYSNIRAILGTASSTGHGRMMMSAYQIGIEFAARFPTDYAGFNKPLGGLGTGRRDSVAKYLAAEMRKQIDARKILDIEILYIDPRHLVSLVFDHNGTQITASCPKSGDSMSFFRLKDPS